MLRDGPERGLTIGRPSHGQSRTPKLVCIIFAEPRAEISAARTTHLITKTIVLRANSFMVSSLSRMVTTVAVASVRFPPSSHFSFVVMMIWREKENQRKEEIFIIF